MSAARTLDVALANADDEAARATLDEIDKVLAINRARYEQGDLSGVEFRRLQVERFRFADDAFAAELALRNARCRLLALLDARPLDQPFDTTDTLLPSTTPAPVAAAAPESADAIIGRALAGRPDVAAARKEAERSAAAVSLQGALRKPSWSVGGGIKRDFGTSGLIVSVGLPLPLFNRNEAGVARAAAEQRQAAALLTAAEVRVSLEVQEALNAVDVARRRVGYVEADYLKSAREALDIVLASYRAGAATLIDYLDAQRALRDARRTQHRAWFDYRISAFELEAALGDAEPAGSR